MDALRAIIRLGWMRVMSHYWRHVRPLRWHFVIAALCLAVEVAVDLSLPRLMTQLVDGVLLRREPADLYTLATLMLAVIAVGWVGGAGCTLFAIRAGVTCATALRQSLFERVLAMPLGQHPELSQGGLLTRLTADVAQWQQMLILLVRGSLRSGLLLVGSLIMAFSMNARLAAVVLASVVLCLLALLVLTRCSNRAFSLAQHTLDRLNEHMQEVFSGMATVKVFAGETPEAQRFDQLDRRYTRASIRVWRLFAFNTPLLLLLLNLAIVSVLWLGGSTWSVGSASAQLVAFINYQVIILSSLTSVGMLLTQFSRARVAVQRLDQLFALSAEPTSASGSRERLRGAIHVEAVDFAYPGGPTVLHGLSFTIAAGEQVVVTGASGSGKSTLLALLAGQFVPTAGCIRFDGREASGFDPQHLRRQIGLVPQETLLFSASLEDNLRLGCPDASAQALARAVNIAQLQPVIYSLPNGYATQLERGGAALSGGQRQRVAIARALLGEPPVVLLDDCASALDNHTATALQRALQVALRGTTRLIVSQDPAVVQAADRVLVLEQGRLIAQGRPNELLHSSASYRQLLHPALHEELS